MGGVNCVRMLVLIRVPPTWAWTELGCRCWFALPYYTRRSALQSPAVNLALNMALITTHVYLNRQKGIAEIVVNSQQSDAAAQLSKAFPLTSFLVQSKRMKLSNEVAHEPIA